MKQHQLKSAKGARTRYRRVGRGDGSGRGNYSGRGMKGQKSRSGGKLRRGFSGGTLPLMKALPILRGFTNIFRVEYQEVNLERLHSLPSDASVNPTTLKELGIVKSDKKPVKILGRGTLERPLNVSAHKFSKSAQAAIEAAGGSVEVV